MAEEGKCPVELKPMEEWVKEGKPEECRPCLLGPVAQWYRDELEGKGHKDKAQVIEKLADETDVNNTEQVLTFCRELDNIKNSVEEPLRERLKDFDCAAQSFDPAAIPQEQEQQAKIS